MDYAMEPVETLIRNAAHLMVVKLAGSLAHVTCKEPIRGSISGQFRNSLHGLGIANELLDQAVQLVTYDNLDLGCVLIEQAATEKCVCTRANGCFARGPSPQTCPPVTFTATSL
ncbi:hypothetical protein ACS0TY_001767 [Phlomoides rotata]